MKEVQEKLFDDLVYHQSNGEEKVEASETVEFTINGQAFEMDLAADNAASFMEIIKPFMDAARPPTKRSGPKKAKSSSGTAAPAPTNAVAKKSTGSKGADEEAQKIRDWAHKNGFDISSRGRIAQEVRDAYAAAQHGAKSGEVTHDQLTDAAPPAEPQLNFDTSGDDSGTDDSSSSTDAAEGAASPADAASEPERV